MEDAQVVYVLDIALLKVQGCAMFFGYEVQGIQCFGLCFGDGRDIWRPGLGEKSSKVPPSILDEHPFWSGLRDWLVV